MDHIFDRSEVTWKELTWKEATTCGAFWQSVKSAWAQVMGGICSDRRFQACRKYLYLILHGTPELTVLHVESRAGQLRISRITSTQSKVGGIAFHSLISSSSTFTLKKAPTLPWFIDKRAPFMHHLTHIQKANPIFIRSLLPTITSHHVPKAHISLPRPLESTTSLSGFPAKPSLPSPTTDPIRSYVVEHIQNTPFRRLHEFFRQNNWHLSYPLFL